MLSLFPRSTQGIVCHGQCCSHRPPSPAGLRSWIWLHSYTALCLTSSLHSLPTLIDQAGVDQIQGKSLSEGMKDCTVSEVHE